MAELTSFAFTTAGRVLFGAGTASQLPELAGNAGTRALVCTGAHPHRHAELINALAMPSTVMTVCGEPTVEVVRAGVELAREDRVDVVVAVGGGSVIDCGKAIAALLGNGGDPLDYLEIVGAGRPLTRPPVACLAVPTTAGGGAEVTANAVLAVPEHQVKVSMRGQATVPSVAVVDPRLTLECPGRVTAASGLDALTQCVEPLVSVRANPVTDAVPTIRARAPYVGFLSDVGRHAGEVKNSFRSRVWRMKPKPSFVMKAKIPRTKTIADTPPTNTTAATALS